MRHCPFGVLLVELEFERSLSLARRQGARAWELRASVSLARLVADGKAARVRRVLGPVYEGFTEGFDTPDLEEAKALLDRPG